MGRVWRTVRVLGNILLIVSQSEFPIRSRGCGVFAPEFLPYSPEVIKEALLQLRQQQGDGCLGIHGNDPLARTQGGITHKLVLISKSLGTEVESARAASPWAPRPKRN